MDESMKTKFDQSFRAFIGHARESLPEMTDDDLHELSRFVFEYAREITGFMAEIKEARESKP